MNGRRTLLAGGSETSPKSWTIIAATTVAWRVTTAFTRLQGSPRTRVFYSLNSTRGLGLSEANTWYTWWFIRCRQWWVVRGLKRCRVKAPVIVECVWTTLRAGGLENRAVPIESFTVRQGEDVGFSQRRASRDTGLRPRAFQHQRGRSHDCSASMVGGEEQRRVAPFVAGTFSCGRPLAPRLTYYHNAPY